MSPPATNALCSFKLSAKYILVLIGLIFVISLSIFTLTELSGGTNGAADDAEADEQAATVVRILMNAQKPEDDADIDTAATRTTTATNKFVLINVQQQNDARRLLSTIMQTEQPAQTSGQRPVRQAPAADSTNATQSSSKHPAGGYYEEQRPVVVHAENLPVLGYRQNGYAPPTAYYEDDDDEADAVNAYRAADGEGDGGGDVYGYYEQQSSYDDEDGARYEALKGSVGAEELEGAGVGEGRAAHGGQYDSYYRQWHYATPAPNAGPRNSEADMGGNRKLQPTYDEHANRDPYAAYDSAAPMSDYDYPAAPVPTHTERPHTGQQQQQEQQLQSQRRPKPVEKRPVPSTENTLLSTLKNLKTMWDIYQAFAAAWNVVAVHRQNQEQQQQKQQQQQLKQKQKEQQQQQQNIKSRINSKRPPKFNNNNSNNNNSGGGSRVKGTRTTKSAAAAKRTTTTTTTASTIAPEGAAADSVLSVEVTPASKVKPPKANKAAAKGDAAAQDDTQGVREKRQMAARQDTKADVGEGRYIKGDPLKGYYDFVITEGSYKFWAVFQTGTALLIIYSTFAAIYYSKVNPLVSDYDYTDYLGGARSLGGGDADFVDDTDDDETAQRHHSRWFNWLPRTGHSLKFIFDALDKLPVDHKAANESNDEVTQGAGDGDGDGATEVLAPDGSREDELASKDALENDENT